MLADYMNARYRLRRIFLNSGISFVALSIIFHTVPIQSCNSPDEILLSQLSGERWTIIVSL